jgi:AcrR family transcriptional regulator
VWLPAPRATCKTRQRSGFGGTVAVGHVGHARHATGRPPRLRWRVTQVAARVGVAQPSLYKHVSGLSAVRRALALRGVRDLRVELLTATAGKPRGDALRTLADAYRSYSGRHPGCYEASVVAPEPGDAEHAQASEEILAVASAVLEGYGVEGPDAVDAIRAIRAALHGYVVLERVGGYRMSRDLDRSFERLVAMLDDALSSWSTTTDSQERLR